MNIRKNMGVVDRVTRIIIAAVIAILYFTNIIGGALGIVLLTLSGIFLLTSFIGFCPLYFPFGISSKTKKTA